MDALDRAVRSPWIKVLDHHFGDASFKLLDVGAGNHSVTRVKRWLPNCEYYGIDKSPDYNNDPADIALMQRFWVIDVDALDLSAIPNEYFDAICMSHVIEHLHHGTEVLRGLVPKLKPGGLFYVETPSPRSLRLPSMTGTLNFHDDPTHVRVYDVPEICRALTEAGCDILVGGRRREVIRMLGTPILSVVRRIRTGRFAATDFWDLLGFANKVVARRASPEHSRAAAP